MADIRIKDLPETLDVGAGDYVAVDNAGEGTRKFTLRQLVASGGGGGLTQTEKDLILMLFSKAAYAESDAESAYDALESLWTTTTRPITYNLSHVSSSNTTASVESGQNYTTTLTASTDYTLNTVTVTMGGVDITSTAYSSGTVSIPSVTGNIVITATAVLAAQSITATYTQSGTVYDTDSLDSLKADLVVTANYSGGTSETVPASNYTLSGTLEEGTSTITVTYGNLTDSFTVTVTANPLPSGYTQYDYLAYDANLGATTTPIITTAQIKSEYTIIARLKLLTGTNSNACPIIGTRAGSGTKQFGLFLTPTTGKLGYWYGGTDTANEILISKDTVHDITVLPVGKSTTYPSNAVIDVDGTEHDTGSTATGQTWSAWFGLLGYASSATAGTGKNANAQLGDVTVKDANGMDVYKFVPVDSGSEKGFYDLVNGVFYPSTVSMLVGYWE